MNKTYLLFLIGAAFLAVLLYKSDKLGIATPGSILVEATSSQITVGTSSPVTLFDRRNGCLMRTVTTNSQRIKLYFSDLVSTSTLLSDVLVRGHHQSASTTEHYDAGEVGCGIVTAIGFGGSNDFPGSTSSSSITISEGR